MKIAVVAVEANKSGGTERYAYELARLVGADLYAACHEGEHTGSPLHTVSTQSQMKSAPTLKCYRVPSLNGPALLYRNLFTLFAQLIVKSNHYDIIHSQGASYLTPNIATAFTSHPLMRRLLKQNEIFLSLSWLRKIYWQVRLFIPYLLERRIYGRDIPILATSNLLKKELVNSYKVPAHRIYVVYPGVDVNEFSPDLNMRERVRKSLNLEGVVCIFVGSQWGRKGLQFLLKAVKEVSTTGDAPITLLVVGSDRGEAKFLSQRAKSKEQRAKSKEQRVSNVRFLGRRADLCEFYNAADIFVLPTLFDAFGLTVLEALACGLPVITSRFDGASEIIRDCGLIIDNPRNPKEIREKIMTLAKDEKLRKQLGERARAQAIHYTWEKMVERIKEIYKIKTIDLRPKTKDHRLFGVQSYVFGL